MTRGPGRLAGELRRIREVSSAVEARLAEMRPSDAARVEKLTLDELQDLSKMVGIAEFLVCKHEENAELRRMLADFAGIVSGAADSLDSMDDEVSELILSAESSLGRIREAHTRISEKADLRGRNSPINLTNSATEINPP